MADYSNDAKPAFYIYQKDDKSWHRTDKSVTKDLNDSVYTHAPIKDYLRGYSYYPQWGEPKYPRSETAWRITKDGEQVARWYWRVDNHDSSHARGCKMLDTSKCGRKVICKLIYDKNKDFWVLADMPCRATDIEAKQLDKM